MILRPVASNDGIPAPDWARKAAQKGQKPMGSHGYCETRGQLVERLGFDDAVTAGAFMQRLTGSWAKADPADFSFVTAVNSGEDWTRMVNQAFSEAGLPPDDNIVQAIAVNGAPFLDILNKQTKPRPGFQTRNNLTMLHQPDHRRSTAQESARR